jgi:FtsZ-interacting cell division protein ZipA
VADKLDSQLQLDEPPVRHRRRAGAVLIVIAALAVIATVSACLWLNYGDLVRSALFAAPPVAAPVIASGEEPVTQKDFASSKRLTAESLQSAIEELDAQKADLKRLSDQVAALTARIDTLQSAAAPTPQPAVPARPVPTAPRQKPSARKPVGSISVGGAPLPAVPEQ